MDAPSVIAGQITPFYNCKLGGSDGRRLIPWGESVADERYVLCDGGDDGLGGTVPNLVGKFILPSTVDESGATGGSQNVTTAEAKIAGTVGETILSIDQIPSHTHSGATGSAGSHSHNRGTMNITGKFWDATKKMPIRVPKGRFTETGCRQAAKAAFLTTTFRLMRRVLGPDQPTQRGRMRTRCPSMQQAEERDIRTPLQVNRTATRSACPFLHFLSWLSL